MNLLERVCGTLDASGIPYALIGAGAMTVHGIGRSTLDLDLLATDRAVLEGPFWKSVTAGGAAADVRRGDADDPLAGVVRFQVENESPVDLVVGRSDWQERVLARAVRMPVGELALPVVGAADLILLKLFAGGSQDAWDVDQLLAVGDRRALVREVESRLVDLPPDAAALWSRILGGERGWSR